MSTIIAGSRSLTDSSILPAVIQASTFQITEVVSGGAKGPDQWGETWARTQTPPLPIKTFLPDWNTKGKSAGLQRNVDMAQYATQLIALWDGTSKGTKHMIHHAKKQNLKIYIHIHTKQPILTTSKKRKRGIDSFFKPSQPRKE